MCGVGVMVKAAVGQGPTKAFVEEQEEEGHLDAFGCQAYEVAPIVKTIFRPPNRSITQDLKWGYRAA